MPKNKQNFLCEEAILIYRFAILSYIIITISFIHKFNLPFSFFIPILLLGMLTIYFINKTKLRLIIILLFFPILYFLVQGLGFILIQLLQNTPDNYIQDFPKYYFNDSFNIFFIVFSIGSISTLLFSRIKIWIYIEIFAYISLIVFILVLHREYDFQELGWFYSNIHFIIHLFFILFTIIFILIINQKAKTYPNINKFNIVSFVYLIINSILILILMLILLHSLRIGQQLNIPMIIIYISLFIINSIVYVIMELGIGIRNHLNPFRSVIVSILKILGIYLIFALIFVIISIFTNKYIYASKSGLLKDSLSGLDFEQYINLESEVNISNETIMYVQMDKAYNIKRWVLSGYRNNNTFVREANKFSDNFPLYTEDFIWSREDIPKYKLRIKSNQRYYIKNFRSDATFHVDFPIEMQTIFHEYPEDSDEYISTFKVMSNVINLDLDSEDSKKFISLLRSVKNYKIVDFLEYYTRGTTDKRITNLALELTKNSKTPIDAVLSIRNYLLDNYEYSLHPGGDNIDDKISFFLFENKKGYCTYFAYSLAIMLRRIGIPCRVVIGFQTKFVNHRLDKYEIRAYNAHAWVEVFFPTFGWITVDVPSYIPISQEGTLQQEEDFDEAIERMETEELEQLDETGTIIKQKKQSFWYLYIIFIILLYILIISIIKFLGKYSISKGIKIKKYTKYYLYVRNRLRDMGINRLNGETIYEFSKSIQNKLNININELTKLYLIAKYGLLYNKPSTKIDNVFRKSLCELRSKIPLWKRILSWLNPVSVFLKKI